MPFSILIITLCCPFVKPQPAASSLHKYSFFRKNPPNLLHNPRFCITIKAYRRFKPAV
nr:MAG TPA: hypothetical protein [Caudoviricetes sp.]